MGLKLRGWLGEKEDGLLIVEYALATVDCSSLEPSVSKLLLRDLPLYFRLSNPSSELPGLRFILLPLNSSISYNNLK